MTYERLTVQRDGAVTRIWLDRPAKLNALDTQTLEEMIAVFEEQQRAFDVAGGRPGRSRQVVLCRGGPRVAAGTAGARLGCERARASLDGAARATGHGSDRAL